MKRHVLSPSNKMRPLLQVRDLLDNVKPTVDLVLHLRCHTLGGGELGTPLKHSSVME